MRLTSEILLRADSYLNTLKEREINLRGLKIPAIENIGILQDQFDIIELSDNEIKKLDNFPRMKRLNTILISNNYISRVGKIGENLSGLTVLILTNNKITNLSEIDNISSIKNLEHLSLLDNPIAQKINYRLYVIYRNSNLKTLDYTKVQQKEKDAAKEYFTSVIGKAMISAITQEASNVEQNGDVSKIKATSVVLTDFQKAQIRTAIEAATTREAIDTIERQLKSGTFVFTPETPSLEIPTTKIDDNKMEEEKA